VNQKPGGRSSLTIVLWLFWLGLVISGLLAVRYMFSADRRAEGLKGTQTFDQAQAATSYSWMWPPSRSCLRTHPPRTGRGSRSGRGSGVLSSRPRWGLRPL